MDIKIIPDFVDEAVSPPAKAIGNSLASLWNLGIGNHIELWVKKQEVRHQQNYQDYMQKVEKKTRSVPEKFLQEPSLNIVGPAIEASKYHIESEELRELFANLIASSVDSRKSEKTHPSFVEIIKQLSPLDAKVLMNFKQSKQLPLVRLVVEKKSGEFITIYEHIMNFNDHSYYKSHISSLSNLQRLGLLYIDYSIHSINEKAYDFIKKHPAFKSAHREMESIKTTDPEYNQVNYQKGVCVKTPLCNDFIDVCL